MPLRVAAVDPAPDEIVTASLLQRHGIGRLPALEGTASGRKRFKIYPIGYFHIDIAQVQTAEERLHLFVAIDRTSRYAFARLEEKATVATASAY